jgi:hypothetical protein
MTKLCPQCGAAMEIDQVLVGVWVMRYHLRTGEERGGHEQQRLTTAALCTRCEYCEELRNYSAKEIER